MILLDSKSFCLCFSKELRGLQCICIKVSFMWFRPSFSCKKFRDAGKLYKNSFASLEGPQAIKKWMYIGFIPACNKATRGDFIAHRPNHFTRTMEAEILPIFHAQLLCLDLCKVMFVFSLENPH